MIPPEPGSATYELYAAAEKQRLRPTKSSIAGSLSQPTDSTDFSGYSMTGYGSSSGGGRSPASGSGGFSSPDGGARRDSHDLSISTGGRGRESLLDNLLLSFDNIGGGLGPFGIESSPYFSTVDEVDDNESDYSRDDHRDTGSGGYNSQFSRRLDSPEEREYGYEGGSFGVTYDSRPNTRSRTGTAGGSGGRGLDSSHGYANGFDPYDSAPAPSIRTRNRTPSPPRSPRLVRRPSNKSIKSLRRGDQHFGIPPETAALPPLPAFANPPPPATAAPSMTTPNNKSSNRPGFFRRVFGGGGSGNSFNNSNNVRSSSSTNGANNTASPAPVSPPAAPSTDTPQSVITKKASFFRRRKKSVSDVNNHPMPPPPIRAATDHEAPPSIEMAGSPVSSLRTAMKPYIRSPRSSAFDNPMDDRECAYLARGATIRTVASSDPISPRRPSFFGESQRVRDSGSSYMDKKEGSGKKYKQECWNARGSTANASEYQTPIAMPRDNVDRPQTSPHSPLSRTFYLETDDSDRDMHWPPSPVPAPRGILTNNGASERERQGSIGLLSFDKGRQSSVASGSSRELPIVNFKDLERMQFDTEDKLKVDKPNNHPQLGLKTSGLEPPKKQDSSWLTSATPPQTAATPTVTLQRDGPGEMAEVLEEDDEDDEEDSKIKREPAEGEPTEEDRMMAQKIYDGDEEFVSKARAAAWLGDADSDRGTVRTAYLELFDWTGVNILSAMRNLCGRVVFKGEAQQVDRIIEELAKRWCQCNPNHGFKGPDVVHTILYSLLLLNTDLHIADIANSQRMTRGQFLKNTMSTIRRGLQDVPAFEDSEMTKPSHHNTAPHRSQTPFQDHDDDSPVRTTAPAATFPGPLGHGRGHSSRPSLEFKSAGSRLSRLGTLSPRAPDKDCEKPDYEMDGDLALVNAPVGGGIRVWETQVEIVLKDFYQSIKAVALPLHGVSQEKVDQHHSNSLNVFGQGGVLRRSASTISKAPSEMSVARRGDSSTKLNTKWASKNRSRQRIYNGSFAGSSRTSLEDRSMWSPSASSTWSKYSLDKTQTSMSVDSLGSSYVQGDYQQSIGFANALSHAIIREEAASGHSGEDHEMEHLDGDDELELHGAPWAKEGMLKHKHHLDSVDKRAKNRAWTECFAVIQRGYMRLFQFPSKNSTGKSTAAAGGVVGGGNWTENAEPIGTFLLRQTIASALPPPGYSKARPNVWALSLPSGAVHFFEVGTSDIVKEFVTTANYWSARLSKEPLIGGVSNVEYGWGDAIVDIDITASPPTSMQSEMAGRPSLQMSIRSSMDHGTIRPRLPGDKVHIKDWSPPAQSMMASVLAEQDQLKALQNYVSNIEADLQRHNELRSPMQLAFSPRHPNSSKALNNWEKKSSYLLREIIKFRTYIETLQGANARREAIKSERPPTAMSDLEIIGTMDSLDIIPQGNKTRAIHMEA
ncbi:hypothetical protein EDC01DRAFT_142815 [Geopyxis carbonaria]|nr:hypothetical protein EDC01DRAFT_142815 [Geopyxis carbonaria]